MDCNDVVFSGHAVRRMFERAIARDDVLHVIQTGETVAEYRDDKPYPSRLLLGFVNGRPVHVVLSLDPTSVTCHVITVYDPERKLWNDDFKRRRSS